jgi:hypothetical protein
MLVAAQIIFWMNAQISLPSQQNKKKKAKKKKNNRLHQNSQQAVPIFKQGYEESMVDSEDDEILQGVHERLVSLFLSSQALVNPNEETFIPSVKNNDIDKLHTPDPRGFIINSQYVILKSHSSHIIPTLIDSSAMISTITEEIVKQLNLEVVSALPLKITYGNRSWSISDQIVHATCLVPGLNRVGASLHVVRQQSVSITMDMGWTLSPKISSHIKLSGLPLARHNCPWKLRKLLSKQETSQLRGKKSLG